MEGRKEGVRLKLSKRFLIVFFAIVISLCVIVPGLWVWVITHQHPGPIFNIGNKFDQPVTVYFEGKKMSKIDPGKSKIFYVSEVFPKDNPDLLLELKSNSGAVLYSRNFTWDGLSVVLQSVTGKPYWIGPDN